MAQHRIAALCASLVLGAAAHAEVTRFEVLQSVPAFEGRSFGSVGPYVRVTGRATIAVDPAPEAGQNAGAELRVVADAGAIPGDFSPAAVVLAVKIFSRDVTRSSTAISGRLS